MRRFAGFVSAAFARANVDRVPIRLAVVEQPRWRVHGPLAGQQARRDQTMKPALGRQIVLFFARTILWERLQRQQRQQRQRSEALDLK